jgi:hypothetical protein
MRDRLRRIGDMRVNKLGFALSRALLAAILSLAGCGSSSHPSVHGPSGEEPNAHVFHVQVDGRQVPCVLVDPPKAAIAVTCDWSAR